MMIHIIIYSIIVLAFIIGGLGYKRLILQQNTARDNYIVLYTKYLEVNRKYNSLKKDTPTRDKHGKFTRRK